MAFYKYTTIFYTFSAYTKMQPEKKLIYLIHNVTGKVVQTIVKIHTTLTSAIPDYYYYISYLAQLRTALC